MSRRWDEVDDVDLLQLEAEMETELQDLREAATVYADRAWARVDGSVKRAPVRSAGALGQRRWMAWTAAAAATAAVAIGGTRLLHRAQPADTSAAVQVQPNANLSDEALLQQIQTDISGGVPAAMEPLQASIPHPEQKAVQ